MSNYKRHKITVTQLSFFKTNRFYVILKYTKIILIIDQSIWNYYKYLLQLSNKLIYNHC